MRDISGRTSLFDSSYDEVKQTYYAFFQFETILPIIVNIRSFHISITIKMQNISRKNEDLLLGIQTVDCRMVDADKSTSHVAIFFNGVIGYHITKL